MMPVTCRCNGLRLTAFEVTSRWRRYRERTNDTVPSFPCAFMSDLKNYGDHGRLRWFKWFKYLASLSSRSIGEQVRSRRSHGSLYDKFPTHLSLEKRHPVFLFDHTVRSHFCLTLTLQLLTSRSLLSSSRRSFLISLSHCAAPLTIVDMTWSVEFEIHQNIFRITFHSLIVSSQWTIQFLTTFVNFRRSSFVFQVHCSSFPFCWYVFIAFPDTKFSILPIPSKAPTPLPRTIPNLRPVLRSRWCDIVITVTMVLNCNKIQCRNVYESSQMCMTLRQHRNCTLQKEQVTGHPSRAPASHAPLSNVSGFSTFRPLRIANSRDEMGIQLQVRDLLICKYLHSFNVFNERVMEIP